MHSPDLSRQDTAGTATVTAGEALARYLHAQAGDFLRSLRMHSESGADTAGVAEAACALRQASRRISGTLHTFRPLLDPAWADGLRAELAWLSATLAQEHACTSRLSRLLDALSRLSGATPLPSARRELRLVGAGDMGASVGRPGEPARVGGAGGLGSSGGSAGAGGPGSSGAAGDPGSTGGTGSTGGHSNSGGTGSTGSHSNSGGTGGHHNTDMPSEAVRPSSPGGPGGPGRLGGSDKIGRAHV